ncbi:ABC transporter ATP-binding protein [Pelotomaculum propionicicum]|uniref:Lipopolysaccharide export system ATP-binding protein LptB n=1 Tax=Pelotomaculum propionicicum TaxID=258475 RepID=A0A4Y7RWU3_9FIRM|nr:ABC transporter ATP-binding protein [Pelotomaculum propionicicum]NLI11233.1 ABC transporter ATP-binding protein [Peptococcaceae bacterium]TEB13323.1 Lipopolysaccharide export system ATP-binding protein LptB [Pelotomaculum propionicicum]
MPILEIKDLSKNFGGLKAVSSFDLTLEENEIVGLIGPNGAGKTTVFNLITGIFPVSSGSIKFMGQDILGMKPFKITQLGIARTFQNIRLFKQCTVLENVRTIFHPRVKYGLMDSFLHTPRYSAEEERITEKSFELLKTMNLDDRAHLTAANLPYGDQRRLEIARALAGEPKLLLLDEPAAGMNPSEVGTLVEMIRFIRDHFNITILLIEHQMGVVMNVCERLVVLDFGEIIAAGLPEEIRNNQKVLEAYLGKGVVSA